MRRLAAEQLARLGPDVATHIDSLAAAVRDRHKRVQHTGPMADPHAGEFAAAPQDCDWEVRRAAVKALGHMSPSAVTEHSPALSHALRDRSPAVRDMADRVLHMICPAAACNLGASLQEGTYRDREAAAHSLGSMQSAIGPAGGKGVLHLHALQGALGDGKHVVRRRAAQVLDALGHNKPLEAEPSVECLQRRASKERSLHLRHSAAWDKPPPWSLTATGPLGSCPGGRHLATCMYPYKRCTCRRALGRRCEAA